MILLFAVYISDGGEKVLSAMINCKMVAKG